MKSYRIMIQIIFAAVFACASGYGFIQLRQHFFNQGADVATFCLNKSIPLRMEGKSVEESMVVWDTCMEENRRKLYYNWEVR